MADESTNSTELDTIIKEQTKTISTLVTQLQQTPGGAAPQTSFNVTPTERPAPPNYLLMGAVLAGAVFLLTRKGR